MCHVLFAKEMKKIRQIWPQQLLKHFTAGYRGFPPCTQSQSLNRETGYSNVPGKYCQGILKVQFNFLMIRESWFSFN